MFPHLVINATSLFFHDRRFETPATEENTTNHVEEWVQGLPPPPLKKQRTSATGSSRSASLRANLNLMKTAAPAAATTSCASIIDSRTDDLRKKPAPTGSKRRVDDLESDSDANDEGTVSYRYEGLGSDEDDTCSQGGGSGYV